MITYQGLEHLQFVVYMLLKSPGHLINNEFTLLRDDLLKVAVLLSIGAEFKSCL
jgi:hypothetical protein